ncbi:MAG: class I SAM-dependent methyltransferase [Patescibacteria group bacterium]
MGHGQQSFDKKYYRRFFDKYTKSEFDKYVNWAYGWIKFLDRYVDIKKGQGRTLLELGSSLGYFSRVFKDRGFDVTGSDISNYIVKKAGSIQKDIKFIKLDIESKLNNSKKYDFIVAFEVLEHLKDPENALKNIKKMLNKNGVLIFSTPYPTKIALADPTHINVHKPSWWRSIGKKAGFIKMQFIYATFIPFLYRISKYLSIGFPFKSDIPYVNSTVFLIFKK